MSSYIDFYQDFLQKKETSVGRRASAVSLPEDERDDGQSVSADITTDNSNKMEHSYTRDNITKPCELTTGLAPARTILVRRPPQCPSCHTHPIEEHDLNDGNQAVIPSYNEIAAKEAMNECARIAKYVKNVNSDEEDWESRISQNGWSTMQKTLYEKVVNILDNDHLGRLSNVGRQNEVMQRRVVTDKSASRMRKVLAAVSWEGRLTQWLHCLLMDHLPPTYMASYLDILQTLKSKVPTLIDKMLFMRPLNVSQELLAPVMKKQWEPVINTKARILSQNVIIVALPSLPYGPIPKRLQKWYQNLASITQIVQVTLPSTGGHTAQQSLNQVAEQIVSLTRVKIQDLRHENIARSIILIGFGAGSALALQVAMSESIAAVVCMGFAYNTLKGVRGTPDDRILDIKVPILFVIGQNSQKTSTEEIECLREKMQSESSLVIVGSGDDMLRVPKNRRKIENVTQSMIDTMVVDEVFEFIKKILINPPGPRVPTLISSMVYSKQNKNNLIADGKVAPIARKRKQDVNTDNETTPAKTKFSPQIGRPRTRPFPSSTPATKHSKIISSSPLQQPKPDLSSNAISNEDLNIAIQSILQDPNTEDAPTRTNTGISENQKKIVTNFELVAQSKSAPIKTALINANNAVGTKIRMIPPNQFMQLKPPVQSQSKIYTIKTTPSGTQQQNGTTNIGSIVNTTTNSGSPGQQHIFTLKSPNGQTTQFVTAAPAAAQQKYTVVKNASGGTTLQLTKNPTGTNQTSVETSGVDISNIIDMPIVFADNEGNIADSVSQNNDANKPTVSGTTKPSTSSGVGQLIISQKIIKDAPTSIAANLPKGGTFVIGRPTVQSQSTIIQPSSFTNKPNKVLFINRNTMKPCSNIIARTNTNQKFAKVVVTNPKLTTGATIVNRPSIILSTTSNTQALSGTSSVVSTVKQLNLQALKTTGITSTNRPTSGILNVSTKSIPQLQIINCPAGSSSTIASSATGIATNTTISPLSDRPQIRNIVVKPGGLKQISPQLTSQLLNRNLTVRKLVNIVPVSKSPNIVTPSTVTVSSPITTQIVADSTVDSATNSMNTIVGATNSSIQSSPRIFTLNPLNTTVTANISSTIIPKPE